MSMAVTIEQKIRDQLDVDHFQILNESHLHRGPATDSHFKIVVVSDDFADKGRVARHQAIYGILADELAADVHALVMHLHTPEEWAQRQGKVPESAPCGGSPKR